MGKGPGRVAGKPFSQLNISRPLRRLSPRRDSHWTTADLYSRFGSHVILYIFEIETQRVDGGTGTHGIMTTKTQLSGASIGSLFSLSCRNLQHFFLNRTCLQPVCTMDMFEPVVEDLNAMF